jgi:6-phosphogluconolactonase
MKKSSIIICTVLSILITSCSTSNNTIRLFTGTYTEGNQKGLFIFDLNPKAGTFKLVSETEVGPNPAYLCISKKYGFIYAANEVDEFNGVKGGAVTTLNYNAKTGVVRKIGELTVPNGGPAYIAISPDDDYLFFANYSGGSVTVVKLNDKGIPVSITDTIVYKGEGGKVSHAHMVSFDPSGERVYVTDLGLDRIVIYNFDSINGKLMQISNGIADLPKGAGPRHFVFTKDGSRLYVISELNSTISFFNVNKDGELQLVQSLSTLREGFKGESYCADIHFGKNDKFLYGSNRGENTIVTFQVGTDGKLSLAGHTSCGGDHPRNFVIDPSGKYILVGNQYTGNISMFSIDEKTGLPVGPSKDYKIASPACLKFFDAR